MFCSRFIDLMSHNYGELNEAMKFISDISKSEEDQGHQDAFEEALNKVRSSS